jgi:uric acid transporter
LHVYVVALAVGFGMIPVVAPNFFGQLPHALQPLLELGNPLAAVVAVILNAFFNGVADAAGARGHCRERRGRRAC